MKTSSIPPPPPPDSQFGQSVLLRSGEYFFLKGIADMFKILNPLRIIKSWLQSFQKDRPTIIHSVRFNNLLDETVIIRLGEEFSFEDEVEGVKVQKFPVEEILVRDNRVSFRTDKYTQHFDNVKICNILFEDADEKTEISKSLKRLLLRAKQNEIISPIDANAMIEQLKGSQQ